jgi:uncharacterized membrane protein
VQRYNIFIRTVVLGAIGSTVGAFIDSGVSKASIRAAIFGTAIVVVIAFILPWGRRDSSG